MYSRDDDWGLNDLEKIRSKHQDKKVTKKNLISSQKKECDVTILWNYKIAIGRQIPNKKQDEKSPFAKNQPVNWWGHKHRYALITPYISF